MGPVSYHDPSERPPARARRSRRTVLRGTWSRELPMGVSSRPHGSPKARISNVPRVYPVVINTKPDAGNRRRMLCRGIASPCQERALFPCDRTANKDWFLISSPPSPREKKVGSKGGQELTRRQNTSSKTALSSLPAGPFLVAGEGEMPDATGWRRAERCPVPR